jgi:aryl-alcohol dehydrogenase-like predicted oxidoreductase
MAETRLSLEQRTFADTGKCVSVLGLGTVKFGRNQKVKYPSGDGFTLPTDQEVESLLDLCLENGINLLDTAPAYGVAEERLGKLLGKRRTNLFLVTKTGEEFENGESRYDFTAQHTRHSIERSLKRLRTDYLDCVLVHSSRDDVTVITQSPVLETLSRMKAEGKILSTGVSTCTVEGGRLAADLTDCVMVSFNRSYTDEKAVIDYAYKNRRAVLIKKGLASGHVDALGGVEENIRFVVETAGVTSLVFGSIRSGSILSNIKALRK